LDGNSFLIIKHGSIHQIGGYIGGHEGIRKNESIARMLIMNDIGDQYVADHAIQRGRLAHDIDAQNITDMCGQFGQDVIAGQPQGVVNVEDQRVTINQGIVFQVTNARVHAVHRHFG